MHLASNTASITTPVSILVSNFTYNFIKSNIFDLVSPVKQSSHSAALSVERSLMFAGTGTFCLPLYAFLLICSSRMLQGILSKF